MVCSMVFRKLFKRTSERLLSFFIKRNHVPRLDLIQKYNQKKTIKKRKISECVIDKTSAKASQEYVVYQGMLLSQSTS